MLPSWDNSVVTQLTIEHSHDRCLRPPSRIEPSMRVKLKSKRRSPVCIQLISCTVLKREICYVLCLIFTAECKHGMIGYKNSPNFRNFFGK